MTTYNTYQEAKIANPESNIYIHTGEFWCEKSIRPSSWTYEFRGFKLCNPADYCMTVEKFLNSGHKFVKSDVVFDFGDVVSIDTEFDVEPYNKTDKMDDRRYILRAAALEEKPKRTKVEYVKCDYGNEHYAAGCDLFACKPLYVLAKNHNYYPIKTQDKAVKASQDGRIYEKVTTELTEREAFVEALQELWIIDGVDGQEQIDKIVDSGLFKLVN